MPCYHPWVHEKHQLLACGQCIGCRLERSREWAVRCVHEASLYEANAFVTLTYAPEHLPAGGTLERCAIPVFIRALRKRLGRSGGRSPVRYFACGEYGDLGQRPHYHALLFNFYPPDAIYAFTTDAGERVYDSAYLDEVWGMGRTQTGAVSFESAAYVARYVVKKVTGAAAQKHYSVVDPQSGEVFERLPERAWMSRKPGIGQGWLQRYMDDVYPSDEVISRGTRVGVPRYYDVLLSRGNPALLERLKRERVVKARGHIDDQRPSRRKATETVKLAQVGFLKRSLEG